MDDHVKKLFWAFWGASFAKEKITQDLIEQYQGLASSIHSKRLEYLYSDTSSANRPNIPKKELDNIISLARARLMMEKSYGLLQAFNGEKAKRVKWFLESAQDSEKRKLMFGNSSIRKLEELKNSNAWVNWLYNQFQQADKDSQKLLQEELLRKKPGGKEIYKDKWEVEVRLDSQSHSLRNSALSEWNKGINSPKLFLANKNELIVKFILPSAVHVTKLWETSLDLLNQFLIAINVGAAGGVIFRNVPRDAARFHSKVTDLELKKEIKVELGTKLNINWKEAGWVINNAVLARTQRVMLLLYSDVKEGNLKLNSYLMSYLQGIVLFSKTDMHLRLEINAFEVFMDCLIGLIKRDNSSITDKNLKEEIPKVLKLVSYDELNRYIDAWHQLKEMKKTSEEITLTDVIGAKMFCDFYIYAKAKENEDRLIKTDNEK